MFHRVLGNMQGDPSNLSFAWRLNVEITAARELLRELTALGKRTRSSEISKALPQSRFISPRSSRCYHTRVRESSPTFRSSIYLRLLAYTAVRRSCMTSSMRRSKRASESIESTFGRGQFRHLECSLDVSTPVSARVCALQYKVDTW